MTKYTFEIKWPEPFKQEWLRSGRVFTTTNEAGGELGAYLAVSADNGTIMSGRLVVLPNYIEESN